jgi:hypothetical protein
MDNEKLKFAFSKIKEEMSELNSEIKKLKKVKSQKTIETKVEDSEIKKEEILEVKEVSSINEQRIEKLTQKIGILEMSLNSLEQSTIETIKRIRDEFDQKLQEEISSIRLELMDVVMRKQQSSTSAFEEELRNTY